MKYIKAPKGKEWSISVTLNVWEGRGGEGTGGEGRGGEGREHR